MRFASSITTATESSQAAAELLEPLDRKLTPGMVDLAMLWVTSHFEDDLDEVLHTIGEGLPTAVLVGCTAEGTLGVDRELERRPSMALIAGTLPEVRIRPFWITREDLETAESADDWERMVGASPDSKPTFIALADPFKFSVHGFLEQVNRLYPGSPIVGGIASGGHRPDQNRLFVRDDVHREGVVGVALSGRVRVDTVVSQGCRPIGKPFVITAGERNVIQALGGEPPLQQLHDVIVDLSPEDEKLARESVLVGRVIDEYKDTFTRGDFLIQNIMGVDRQSGAIAIAGFARVGATVQFHVRDAASADEDLRHLLEPYADRQIDGAMLFDCNGRGTHMWQESGHDIVVLRELLGPVPAAGFFCGGEFGPVGGKNFVHGFTASVALFSDPDPAAFVID